jgi:hypothetical protein
MLSQSETVILIQSAVLQVNRICSPSGEVGAGVRGQVVWARGLAGPRGRQGGGPTT